MATRPPVGGRRNKGSNPGLGRALALFAVLALAVPFFAFVPQPVAATPEVLRESYAPSTWDRSFANVYVNQRDAQSFLARTDFLLTHVELYVFDQPNPPPDLLQVFIASDGGNQPGAVLAGTAQQGVRNWTWVAFSFYPWVPISAGLRYWIIAEDSQPRPKAYEWGTNQPGGYGSGEAQWYDANAAQWVNNTGADFFFKAFGLSGPSLGLELEPVNLPVDPGAEVPIDVYFNNSGNEAAKTARIEMRLDSALVYQGDDASLEGGVQVSPLSWSFNGVAAGPHRMTVWVRVDPNRNYYDGENLQAHAFLNYTEAGGQLQTTTPETATVTVLVPVIRAQAVPNPAHVAVGETFNFTVSFFNIGSGRARFLWLNGTPGTSLAVLGDDAASQGARVLGPLSWLFENVSAQAYVFNITVQAPSVAVPGDRLAFRLDVEYTDGGGHRAGTLSVDAAAMIHGPSLVVVAVVDNPTPRPGDAIYAVFYLNNTGDENASWVWLNVTLPPFTALEDSQPVAGVITGSAVAYALPDVAPADFSITARLRVSGDAPPEAGMSVGATLEVENRSGVKLRPSSASATSVVITPRFGLILGSSATSVGPGDPFDLILGWNNSGNEAASRVWLNLTLPAKTLLVNATVPWSTTNGTTYGWLFFGVRPGLRTFGVRLEASPRLGDGDTLLARLNLSYERLDGIVRPATGTSETFDATNPAPPPGLEVLLLWLAVLIALLFLFLLLGYMDVLPHRRGSIDDVFLLHNSGILICHYSTTLRPDVDSDIASGMLMAVRNFVADALRSKNGSLQELKYGDYRIEMAHGRHAILVVFTRGHPAKGLQARMAEALGNIETAYEHVLESWSGRTEDLKGVEEHLLRLVAA